MGAAVSYCDLPRAFALREPVLQDSDEVFEPTGSHPGAIGPGGDAIGVGETGLPDVAEMRVRAVVAAARYHGIDLDRSELRLQPGAEPPIPATLVAWVRNAGLWAKAERLTWRNLMKLNGPAPVVLLFNDGSAAC